LTLCTTKNSSSDQSGSGSSASSENNDDENDRPSNKNVDDDDDEGSMDGQSNSSPGFDNGSISNLMSEDTNNIMMFFWNVHFIWAIPLKVRPRPRTKSKEL